MTALPAAGLLALTALCAVPVAATAEGGDRIVSFALIPDAHTCTATLRYLPGIVDRINALDPPPDFVVSLGDNVSGGEQDKVLEDARRYHSEIARLRAPHYYVIGNHECIPVEVYRLLTWGELLEAWEMQERWYSFDLAGLHVIVLDSWSPLLTARYAEVFERQKAWLTADLAATELPTLIFLHEAIGFQREDLQDWIDTDNRKFWPPRNFLETAFEAHADKIIGVFEGHKHKSLWKTLNGVTYHQMGASHAHDGQFAQVFVDPAIRAVFVQAHPEVAQQDPAATIQLTYGDRSLVERFRTQPQPEAAPR